ncbi:MAG TPA: hypothetical protein VGZ52_06335, partial [Acidimicrobiales bacterium]|nr:hypothetical protein [Acidimicrobiales bacterium]
RGASTAHRLLALVVVAGVVGYVFTPLTGGFGFVFNLRYLAPVLLVALVLLPVTMPAARSWRVACVSLSSLLILIDATMPNRERIAAWPSGRILPTVLAVAALVALGVVVARSRRAPVLALGALVVVAGFWFAQRSYEHRRYVAAGLENDAVNAYFRGVHRAKVVVFGSDELYPFFGADLTNRVRRGDIPPLVVGNDACRRWRAELGSSADYVVLMQVRFGYFESPPVDVIADDPAARLVLAANGNAVYRVSGALDPTACPTGA